MNIKELIEMLYQFDPETRVIVKGYEDGFNDISEVKEMSIMLNVHREWYYGVHDKPCPEYKEMLPNSTEVKAIYLGGKNPETEGFTYEERFYHNKTP